ncbi:hypothetical protein SAMN05518801_11088 [Novosphingobium sp. CF614]|uniref:hypothetical protein n=1 Tax=Novosphingobium sp. CF614 TaxID=1884364 RepID=UPI0008EA90E5|nr:hypothetical protein [Novosphingobium sp. CF614]SFG21061.1 hypothetical protein SAMN05518801_11088 [Novosphingobium sp. CF614]
MNIFVLCTGRCGSRSFVQACKHITNYSAGHETRVRLVGADKFAYPANHIEADNRLSWHLGRLDDVYGDDAFYVHLHRDRTKVIASYAQRWAPVGGMMPAYRNGILRAGTHSKLVIAEDFVATVEANIASFLRNKSMTMSVALEAVTDWFPIFWQRIGAQGDLEQALAEWSYLHNSRRERTGVRKFKQKLKGIQQILFEPPLA